MTKSSAGHPTGPGKDEDVDINPSLIASRADTLAEMLHRSGRKGDAVPIRRAFVQPHDRAARSRGGPLAELVRHRDERALEAMLLVTALATKEPWDVARDSRVWARALGLGDTRSSREAVSKTWRRLQDLDLVSTSRRKRMAIITLRREDGSDTDYTYPEADLAEDRYLRLPFAYWLDGWHQKLSLPGKAMLLVLLAEKNNVDLPLDRIPDWYGISRATAQRGLTELERLGLLKTTGAQKKAPLAPLGYTIERRHLLRGPFAKPDKTKPAAASAAPAPSAASGDLPGVSPAKRRKLRRRRTATSTSTIPVAGEG